MSIVLTRPPVSRLVRKDMGAHEHEGIFNITLFFCAKIKYLEFE